MLVPDDEVLPSFTVTRSMNVMNNNRFATLLCMSVVCVYGFAVMGCNTQEPVDGSNPASSDHDDHDHADGDHDHADGDHDHQAGQCGDGHPLNLLGAIHDKYQQHAGRHDAG
mgnify:CR=1 FL=1